MVAGKANRNKALHKLEQKGGLGETENSEIKQTNESLPSRLATCAVFCGLHILPLIQEMCITSTQTVPIPPAVNPYYEQLIRSLLAHP